MSLFVFIQPSSASVDAEPSRLFSACEHLLSPPDVRLWRVERNGRDMILMTSRNVASIRHIPPSVSNVIASARRVVSTELNPRIKSSLVDDLQRRAHAGEDFGLREGLGARVDELGRILARAGVPEHRLSTVPPFMVSTLLLAGVLHTSIRDSRVVADIDYARFLVDLSPATVPTLRELEILSREIDFKKSVVEFARASGATTSDFLSEKEARSFIAHFEKLEFIVSLLDSVRAPRIAQFRLDLFDLDQKRLDARVDEFLALVPAMGTLRDSSLAHYLATIDDLLAHHERSLIHSDALTLAGERGLLRRLKERGYRVDAIDTSLRTLR